MSGYTNMDTWDYDYEDDRPRRFRLYDNWTLHA